MMYDVEIDGRIRKVVLERAGDRFRVSVNGRAHVLDVRRPDPDSLSLLVPDEASGRTVSWDVGIGEGPAGDLIVHVNGTPVRARVDVARGAWAKRRGDETGGAAGPARIKAPMPGKVVRVLVVPGDPVVARQGLVVVEAMKMENELRSPKDGRVKEVTVTEGTSVEAGAVLVVVE